MKLQLVMYVLCFLAVASIGLRAETVGPLFGGTADGVFEIQTTDQPMVGSITMVSDAQATMCEKPLCPKSPAPAIAAAAKATQP